MSNLVKQHYVANVEKEARVINSDSRYVERISHNPQPQPAQAIQPVEESGYDTEEIIDGFLAGLDAETVIQEPAIIPEELIEQARAEADEILAAARAEAMQIAERAQKEAALQLEQSKAEGYNSGVALLKAEVQSEKNRLQEEYSLQKEQMKKEYQDKMTTMESDIVDAVIAVFNRVFDIQFDNKKQILLYLIHNTLMNVEVGKEFHIRVSSANYKFIESHIGDIKEKIGNDIGIEIVNDPSLGAEDCIIDTEFGVFNCGIDMELSNLEKDIRSLCG